MILDNGLSITKDGFRSVDPATGKIDYAVFNSKGTCLHTDSLVAFVDMPKEAYELMSDNDLKVVKSYGAIR